MMNFHKYLRPVSPSQSDIMFISQVYALLQVNNCSMSHTRDANTNIYHSRRKTISGNCSSSSLHEGILTSFQQFFFGMLTSRYRKTENKYGISLVHLNLLTGNHLHTFTSSINLPTGNHLLHNAKFSRSFSWPVLHKSQDTSRSLYGIPESRQVQGICSYVQIHPQYSVPCLV